MAVRLILFDIDGTLIRTGGAGVRAFGLTGEGEFGVRDGVRHMHFAGRTDTSLVREFLRYHRIAESPENIERFFDRYVFLLDHWLTRLEGWVCAGVAEFIERTRALTPRPRLGLLTGNIRLGAEIKLRHFGLWDRFEVGAFGDDHEDRNELAKVAQRRGSQLCGRALTGAEILVVGDTPADIVCGRAIGGRTLAVTTGGATRAALEAHRPDWLVDSMAEVPAESLGEG